MRRTIGVGVLALALAGLAVRGSAAGLESERVVAHVPFAFEVGDTTLPPGDYSLQQASDLDPNLLELRSRDARRAMFFFVNDAGTKTAGAVRPELIFDRLGNERFLRTVRLEDGARELLSTSPDEVAAARGTAGLRSSPIPRP